MRDRLAGPERRGQSAPPRKNWPPAPRALAPPPQTSAQTFHSREQQQHLDIGPAWGPCE